MSNVITLDECGIGACSTDVSGIQRCACGGSLIVYHKTKRKGHELIQCVECRQIIGDYRVTRKRSKVKWYA